MFSGSMPLPSRCTLFCGQQRRPTARLCMTMGAAAGSGHMLRQHPTSSAVPGLQYRVLLCTSSVSTAYSHCVATHSRQPAANRTPAPAGPPQLC
jgi:hypothetical protein